MEEFCALSRSQPRADTRTSSPEGEVSSFPPVAAPACRVLVLGSMPGVASLRAHEYYAHPRNAFWPILYALWGEGTPDPVYEKRLAFALSHRVAIWDVAKTCVRRGSSDASIRNAVPNDFEALFESCPNIELICYNGRLAESLFEKLAADTAGARRRVLLPSTSPAYTLPFEDKLAAWQVVREATEEESSL